MADTERAKLLEELPSGLRPAFAPLVKHALGASLGIVTALAFFLLALEPVVFGYGRITDTVVGLLGHNFFPGYDASVQGALIGIPWGLVTGFLAGWLLALFRNRAIATWVFFVGARERLKASATILDDMM